ncbi:unnamed protein product [Orchesella dallaii]
MSQSDQADPNLGIVLRLRDFNDESESEEDPQMEVGVDEEEVDDWDDDVPAFAVPASAVPSSADVYLVKEYAFQWAVDPQSRIKKEYQTDITICWNKIVNENESFGIGVEKSRLLKSLEKSFNLSLPLRLNWITAMSLKRRFSEVFSDYCIFFNVNDENEFIRKLKHAMVNSVLMVELKMGDVTETINFRLDSDDIAEPKFFKRDFSRLANKKLKIGEHVDGSLSVKIHGEERMYVETYEGFNILEKLLDDSDADFTLVSSNGAEIKCHQLILKLHSPVFRSMIESGMQETATRKVAMDGMPEDAVRALVKFLYTWDLSEPIKNLSIAIQLLQAGHKYEIKDLERAMIQLFGAKRSLDDYKTWFSKTAMDDIFELYVFAHEVGSPFEEVEDACIKMFKLRRDDVGRTQRFKQIFLTNPALAMELCLSMAK